MEGLRFLLEVIVILIASQFILGPLVLYLVTRHAANPEFETFDLTHPPLKLPQSYAQNIARLEELGFQAKAHVFGSRQTATVRSVLTLFTNQTEKDTAILAHMLSEIPLLARSVIDYVEFSTDFADGSEVNTANAKQPSLFVQVPEKKIYRVPHLTDTGQLYVLHRALVAKEPAKEKRLPSPGEEVDSLISTMKRDLAREAGFGRLRRAGHWYRLTVKGAILYELKFGLPVGYLRRQVQYFRGKRLAREVLRDS